MLSFMVAISNKPLSVVRTPSSSETTRAAPAATPQQAPAKGWAATSAPRQTPVQSPSVTSTAAASSSSGSVPIGPFATGVSMMVKAMLDDSDPVSTSLTSNAAVDQLLASSMSAVQRELNDRGEMGAAVELSKQFASIPKPVADRSEPMETVASNSERASQMFGLLEKMSGALGRMTQSNNDPTLSMQSMVVASGNKLVKAEVDLALGLNKAYGAEQDPALAQKTQAFLEGLPAQVAKGTESITDLGQKLKTKNELAASLINEFAAKNL